MMTPPTTAIGRARQQPPVAQIDGFRGQLITPEHADYDSARAVWNGAIDRRPRLIARCIGTTDVLAAVRFGGARRRGFVPRDTILHVSGLVDAGKPRPSCEFVGG